MKDTVQLHKHDTYTVLVHFPITNSALNKKLVLPTKCRLGLFINQLANVYTKC